MSPKRWPKTQPCIKPWPTAVHSSRGGGCSQPIHPIPRQPHLMRGPHLAPQLARQGSYRCSWHSKAADLPRCSAKKIKNPDPKVWSRAWPPAVVLTAMCGSIQEPDGATRNRRQADQPTKTRPASAAYDSGSGTTGKFEERVIWYRGNAFAPPAPE